MQQHERALPSKKKHHQRDIWNDVPRLQEKMDGVVAVIIRKNDLEPCQRSWLREIDPDRKLGRRLTVPDPIHPDDRGHDIVIPGYRGDWLEFERVYSGVRFDESRRDPVRNRMVVTPTLAMNDTKDIRIVFFPDSRSFEMFAVSWAALEKGQSPLSSLCIVWPTFHMLTDADKMTPEEQSEYKFRTAVWNIDDYLRSKTFEWREKPPHGFCVMPAFSGRIVLQAIRSLTCDAERIITYGSIKTILCELIIDNTRRGLCQISDVESLIEACYEINDWNVPREVAREVMKLGKTLMDPVYTEEVHDRMKTFIRYSPVVHLSGWTDEQMENISDHLTGSIEKPPFLFHDPPMRPHRFVAGNWSRQEAFQFIGVRGMKGVPDDFVRMRRVRTKDHNGNRILLYEGLYSKRLKNIVFGMASHDLITPDESARGFRWAEAMRKVEVERTMKAELRELRAKKNAVNGRLHIAENEITDLRGRLIDKNKTIDALETDFTRHIAMMARVHAFVGQKDTESRKKGMEILMMYLLRLRADGIISEPDEDARAFFEHIGLSNEMIFTATSYEMLKIRRDRIREAARTGNPMVFKRSVRVDPPARDPRFVVVKNLNDVPMPPFYPDEKTAAEEALRLARESGTVRMIVRVDLADEQHDMGVWTDFRWRPRYIYPSKNAEPSVGIIRYVIVQDNAIYSHTHYSHNEAATVAAELHGRMPEHDWAVWSVTWNSTSKTWNPRDCTEQF